MRLINALFHSCCSTNLLKQIKIKSKMCDNAPMGLHTQFKIGKGLRRRATIFGGNYCKLKERYCMKSGIIGNIRLKEKKCRNKMQQAPVFRVDELLKSDSKNQIGFFRTHDCNLELWLPACATKK